jgi:hypothetical protein
MDIWCELGAWISEWTYGRYGASISFPFLFFLLLMMDHRLYLRTLWGLGRIHGTDWEMNEWMSFGDLTGFSSHSSPCNSGLLEMWCDVSLAKLDGEGPPITSKHLPPPFASEPMPIHNYPSSPNKNWWNFTQMRLKWFDGHVEFWPPNFLATRQIPNLSIKINKSIP